MVHLNVHPYDDFLVRRVIVASIGCPGRSVKLDALLVRGDERIPDYVWVRSRVRFGLLVRYLQHVEMGESGGERRTLCSCISIFHIQYGGPLFWKGNLTPCTWRDQRRDFRPCSGNRR